MPNIIAKKLNVTLDTIKQKMIRTDFIAIVGDSIEITVNITENNQPKDITGASCRLVGTRSDKSYFEQTEKITVADGLNGVVKIYPRLDMFNVEGQTVCGLLIEDMDETINIQRFAITVSKSMVSDIIVETKDGIETLKELNNLLTSYQNDLVRVGQSVVDMEELVAQKTNEVNTSFSVLNDNIENQIGALQNNINGINNTVNYELTKAVKLKSRDILGSSFVYFETEPFTITADKLLTRSYIMFISGIVDINTHNSAVGILTFFKQNNKIYTNVVNLSDRVVVKNLSPSVVFSDLTIEILPSATNFKLMVKSNILKSLNTEESIRCILTPLGVQ